MIEPGYYVTRAVGPMEFFVASTGSKGVKVPFQVNGEPIEWVGWLTERAEARTAESLALLGYDGEREESVCDREAQLVIEHEEYEADTQDGTGKETRKVAKIKWINDPNRSRGFGEPLDAAAKVEAKGRLRALVLAQRQKLTGATPKASALPALSFRVKF